MESKENENKLEKSGLSYLENSQLLYHNSNGEVSNSAQQDFQQQLQNYHNLSQSNNPNQKYHFEYSGQPYDKNERIKNNSFFNDNINNITFGSQNTLSLDNSINNIPLSKTQIINPNRINSKINPLERSQLINRKGISLEQSTLLNSTCQDLSNSITIKKRNIFLTKSHYVGFVNNIGDNSCYVNVVLHLLYHMTDICNILKDINQIEEIKNTEKEKVYNIPANNNETPTSEELLSSIGELLSMYEIYLQKENCVKQVTILNSNEIRKLLDKYSNGIFALNYVADPVELLLYLLDILNKNYREQIHSNFYLNLVDKFNCSKRCTSSMKVRFDQDNFSYHIYVDELLNYIKDEGMKFKDTKENLFELSLSLFQSEIKVCEKCSVLYEKYLFCYTNPKYLLINCVWKNQVPDPYTILEFLFLLSVEEDLQRLFICPSSGNKTKYNLEGMILYSYSLCHYAVLIYNKKDKVFVFHNDDIVIEYKTLYECFYEILINNINLYDNDKAYFYPTMLFYTRETIYDRNDIKKNELNDFKYVELYAKMEQNQKNYIKRHTLSEEQKRKNLEELIRKQREYEQNMINQQKKSEEEKKTKIKNNIDNNIDNNTNIPIDNNINRNIDNNHKKNISKSTLALDDKNKYNNLKGSDLLKLSGSQNILIEKNHISQMDLAHSFNNDINKKININNNNNDIQLDFLKDIRQQSNEYNNIDFKKPNNNMMLSQRMDMKHDFNEINEDNKLARTQFITGTDYFNNINKKMNNNSNKKQTNKISNKIKNPEESKDIIYKSQQIFYNNNFNSSINEQSNLNNNNNFLGKSQQNLGYRNKK